MIEVPNYLGNDFATPFPREKRPPCQLYLISPLDVTGTFPDRLRRAR
jgi:thiamine-phosphate pyrophosphorylase